MSLPNLSCSRNVSSDSVTEMGWIVGHPDDPNFGNGYAIAVILLLFFLVGVPWNVFAICMIVRKKLYSNPTIMLLLNLAITHLIELIFMPFNIITGFNGEFIFGNSDAIRCHVCQMIGFVIILLPTVSASTLFLISVDRFLYLKRPLRYSSTVTSKRTLIAIFTVWVIGIVSAFPPLIGLVVVEFTPSIVSCGPLYIRGTALSPNVIYVLLVFGVNSILVAATIAMYACVIYIARKSIVAKLRRTINSTSFQENSSTTSAERQARSAQLQLVKLFTAIFSAFVIAWLLMLTSALTAAISGGIISLPLNTVAYLSLYFQTVILPILQVYLVKELREIVSGFFKWCRKTSN